MPNKIPVIRYLVENNIFYSRDERVKQLETGEAMKYAVLIGDGMADYPIEKLGEQDHSPGSPNPCYGLYRSSRKNRACKNYT